VFLDVLHDETSLKPEYAILLAMGVHSAGSMAQEEMQQEVSRQFKQLEDDVWFTVDASQSVEEIEKEASLLWPCSQ
jgi:thymidylate kinase